MHSAHQKLHIYQRPAHQLPVFEKLLQEAELKYLGGGFMSSTFGFLQMTRSLLNVKVLQWFFSAEPFSSQGWG